MVGEEGVEPSRAKAHRILSPARIPVPPLAHEYPITSVVYRGVLYYTYDQLSSTSGTAFSMKNPLFPTDDPNDNGYVLNRGTNSGPQPPSASDNSKTAADLVRQVRLADSLHEQVVVAGRNRETAEV